MNMTTETENLTRAEAISQIKAALKARTKTKFSVTGGAGTSYGWICIHSIPSRRGEFDYMNKDDQKELSGIMGETIYNQGFNIPAQNDFYRAAIQRCKGEAVTKQPVPNWD